MDSAIIVAIVALMGTILTTVLNMRFRNLQEEVEEAHKDIRTLTDKLDNHITYHLTTKRKHNERR